MILHEHKGLLRLELVYDRETQQPLLYTVRYREHTEENWRRKGTWTRDNFLQAVIVYSQGVSRINAEQEQIKA